jgi:DNA polymerase III delta subunit
MSEKEAKIYLITGDDEFAVKNKTRSIIVSLCGESPEENPSLEIIHGDPDEKKTPVELLGMAMDAIATPPFLSDKKVIWLKNFDFEIFSGKGVKGAEGEKNFNILAQRLLESVKTGLPDSVSMVMSIFSIDKRSSIYKACARNGEVHEFEKISIDMKNLSDVLGKHISETCSVLDIRLSANARDFLVEACGANYARIINELEKLAAYVHPGKEVGMDDCVHICSMTPELASWAFTDAVAQKNFRSALKALEIILTPKNPEISVLYSMTRLFSDMIQVKTAARKLGINANDSFFQFKSKLETVPPDLKEELKENSIFSSHPYKSFKSVERSANFADESFATAFSEILKVNKALVSGAVSPRLELENLAIKLCRLT